MPRPLVRPDDIGAAERRALDSGALVAVREDHARFELTGTGRVACLQGVVTCEVEKSGGAKSLFGALLTNKGMIVTPLWIALLEERIVLEAPAAAAPALAETFAKTLPPRLCRWADITAATTSLVSFGPAALPFAGAMPAVARGTGGIERIASTEDSTRIVTGLIANGAIRASSALLERCRIEAGIPRLGAEIDEKTLPQEAGIERLGAVSYTKGCYIGQETVARLHYRGHANRRLASLDLDGEPTAVPAELSADGKAAGRLTSAAWSDVTGGWIGLALVRREVLDGASLAFPGGSATVRGERWIRPA